MGEIIDVRKLKNKNAGAELTPEKMDADIARIKEGLDILTCRNRAAGLSIRYAETLRDSVYSISISENVTEEHRVAMLCTDNYEHGLEVYRELEEHVLSGDRDFTELCGLLNNKS